MKCELCRVEGNRDPGGGPTEWTVHGGVEIAEEEKERLFAALDAVSDDAEQEALNLCLQKLQHLLAIKGNLVAREEQLRATGDPNAHRRLNAKVRGALFDWLQSIRAYLDHTETRIKRRYGKNSDEFKKFDTATSKLYDSFFAYRFLYHLRNAQHVDFAPISVLISESTSGELSASVRFRRDELLSKFDKWKGVKAELAEFPEEFLVDEHVLTMMQCLEWLAHVVAGIERPHLAEHVDMIEETTPRVPDGPGYPAVVCLPEAGDPDQIQVRQLFKVVLRSRETPQVVGRPLGRGDEWVTWEG